MDSFACNLQSDEFEAPYEPTPEDWAELAQADAERTLDRFTIKPGDSVRNPYFPRATYRVLSVDSYGVLTVEGENGQTFQGCLT